MKVRFVIFLFVFGFVVSSVFSATTQPADSSSSQLGKPSVKFEEWQIGRSDKNTDTSSPNHNPTSFITSTQDKCHFTASVVYDGNQGDSVSPIDPKTIKWTITGQDPSGLELQTPETNWSGSHPSKLAGTSFNVVGTISLPAVVGSRTVTLKDGRKKQVPDYLTATSCSHTDDADRLKREPRHRNNTKLGFTLVFSAKTEDGQSIKPAELVLKADEIDQVRQEYVDYNRPIPTRSGYEETLWQNQDTYDFGHYKIMLNAGLYNYHTKWLNKLNERTGKSLSLSALFETSGYRNPHHNFDHTPSTANLSPHMYGYALDVRGKDVQEKYGFTQSDMVDAAEDAGARGRYTYPSGHVHADWAPDNWASRTYTSSTAKAKPYKLPPAGTDTRAVVEKPDEKKEAQKLACGHIDDGSGEHFLVYFTGCSHNDYYCYRKDHGDGCPEYIYPDERVSPDQVAGEILGDCGHWYKPTPATIQVHRLGYCPRNDSGEVCLTGENGQYWLCQSHTHRYPDGTVSAPEVPKQVQPAPKPVVNPKVVVPKETTTDPPPKQVLPKENTDSDDDDDADSTPVDPEVTSPCGHTHKTSLAASHREVSFNCGSHSYYACKPPSSSETNRHITQTLACGNHVGRACTASTSHLSVVSCPTKNGNSCSYGSYYACSVHTHAYPQTKAPQPQVQYHSCGYHPTTDSGNHSYVSSCSVSNSNGSCTNSSGYYACTPHSHSFPDPPQTPNVPEAPPKQDPPKPDPPVSTVKCGNRWQGSGACKYGRVVSRSSTEHQSSACALGHTYWTCNPTVNVSRWESKHRTRTCPLKNGVSCSDGSYTKCGSHTHSYPASKVRCPANGWTDCGGSSSTAHKSSACSAGHTYWTCNSGVNVSRWENKHRTRTCRRSGCSNSWQACVDGWTAPRCNAKSGAGCWAR